MMKRRYIKKPIKSVRIGKLTMSLYKNKDIGIRKHECTIVLNKREVETFANFLVESEE